MLIKAFNYTPRNPELTDAEKQFDYTGYGKLPAVVIVKGVYYELKTTPIGYNYYVYNPYQWIDTRPKVIEGALA